IQDKTENSFWAKTGYKLNDDGLFLKTRFFPKKRETSFHFRGDFSVLAAPSLKMNSRFFLQHENSVDECVETFLPEALRNRAQIK
ncbi:MAG: hypothetical protein IJT77_09140, partial [Clostridia bacterium]|nr:hypothetical protein [Clostridia bacterium]